MSEEVQGVIEGADSPAVQQQSSGNEMPSEVSDVAQVEAPDVAGQSTVPTDRPIENILAENRRKSAEIAELRDEMSRLRNDISDGFKSVKQEREPTVAELDAFAQSTDNPAHRNWALSKIDELKRQEVAKVIDQRFSEFDKRQRDTAVRNESFKYVAANYGDMFLKDNLGNLITDGSGKAVWNTESKQAVLTAQILQSDVGLQNDPAGLLKASEIAYARLSRLNSGVTQKTLAENQATIKDLQKRTMVTGSGVQQVPQRDAHRASVEKSRSGRLSDAHSAMKSILSRQGVLGD